MSEQAVANARDDVQSINALPNSGDKTQAISLEVNKARQEFSDPKDYNSYVQGLKEGLKTSDPNLVPAIELFDSASASEQSKLLQSVSRNGDEAYKVLDTYGSKHGEGQLDGRGSGADGKVGTEDIDSFLKDSTVPGTKAYELAQKDPKLAELVKNEAPLGFDRDELVHNAGYENFGDFSKDHPDTAQKTVVIKDDKGRPETIVEPNGTSNGLHYDSNGNIDGLNYTVNKDGQQVSGQAKLNEQGQWVDENGKPAERVAPFIDDQGNFGFYMPTEGSPTKFNKYVVDSNTGNVNSSEVDLNGTNSDGTPVSIHGLNRPGSVDPKNNDPFKVGRLDVTAVPQKTDQPLDPSLPNEAQAGYAIKDGDNLTNIARAALGVDPKYDGPEVQAALTQLAHANGYENADQIPAGATLVIPPDFNTMPTKK